MGKLGQLLVARGWITVQQLTRALQNQRVVGGRLGTCLLEIDAISEDLLLKGLAEQHGVPAVGLDDLRRIPDEVIALLPDKIARRCRAVPFQLEGSRLDLAMMDARNLACQDEIAFATGKRVRIHVTHELRILEALERFYKEESPSRFSLLVERLNRARYFWEKQAAEPAAERDESAATLATPLSEFYGERPQQISPPPPLPEFRVPPGVAGLQPPRPAPRPVPAPVAPAPPAALSPAPPAAPAPAAPVAPVTPVATRAAPAPRPLTIPLTAEERAELAARAAATAVASAPPAPPAPIAPPEPPRPEPLPDLSTVEAVEKALEATSDRERVGQIVLGFLRLNHRRAALFQIGRDKVLAWMGQGDLDEEKLGRFSVSFDQPSVFLNLRQGSAFYVGPMPPMPAHRQLAAAWGGELPRDCVLLPIKMKDRMVAVIYADGTKKGLAGIDLQQLQRLAASTADALQRCILHKKKGEAGA